MEILLYGLPLYQIKPCYHDNLKIFLKFCKFCCQRMKVLTSILNITNPISINNKNILNIFFISSFINMIFINIIIASLSFCFSQWIPFLQKDSKMFPFTLEKKQFDNLYFNKSISSKFQRFCWIPFLQKDSTMFPFTLGKKTI